MKMKIGLALSLLFVSTVAICQEVAVEPGIGSVLLPFLPAAAADTLAIVFATMGAMNAVSIVLEKIAAKTSTDKDDKAVAKLKNGVAAVQKVLNFFIAKR